MLAVIIRLYCVKLFSRHSKISEATVSMKCPLLLNMPMDFGNMPFNFTEQFSHCPCDALECVYSAVDS